ncbi:nitroreductase family protein [Nanchangia anserum]|uniref:Nitroreductase family protein n=1 Tax=Nanchangia anserum TaxID=2692125 RepID=A0A8I0GA20_9ACTO|nr:nitroreductase family protein [Nanchangia anserum]QOX82571.1 nitroreductase family protein [Nanchangia anserum]
MMTPTIATQLAHRTIRSYTDEPVSEEAIASLYEAARRSATWAFYQHRTIIRVRDPRIRQVIAHSSTQPYVAAERGELFIFVVDLYRNSRIRAEQGVDSEWYHTTQAFLTGVGDTMLAAQNFVVAAESMGLGTVFLGSIGREVREVISALELPTLTYPLVGVLVGHPAEKPQIKPRLPIAAMTACDTYPMRESVCEALADYDEVVQTYYDLRDTNRRVDSFTRQIATNPGRGGAEVTDVLAVLHDQGLALR